MTTKPLKFVVSLAAATALLILSGCADKANPDNVDQRSVERWKFLIAHQAEKAYDYLTPGVRTTRTREDYASAMNNRPVQWKAVKFNRKECDTDRCTVHVDVTYSLVMPGVGKAIEATRTQDENWILVKGEWYFLPSD
ncbi:hypothetical protein [Dokdonella soli]|uniref:Lipoprotein n=1 Tax=Dokdonella soli TaxID=529810 RepID=A0ABN1II62_9GAMM